MRLSPLPAQAAWRHHTARDAVEVVQAVVGPGRRLALRGAATGVEDGAGWSTTYVVEADPGWRTVSAEVRSVWPVDRVVRLERDDRGRWLVDGRERPDLDGCVDVDLEASVVTNTLPVHRLAVDEAAVGAVDGAVDGRREVPAAYVRVDLTVERLEQTYGPVEAVPGGWRVGYEAPAFDVRCGLSLDDAGLVLDYPGLARRLL